MWLKNALSRKMSKSLLNYTFQYGLALIVSGNFVYQIAQKPPLPCFFAVFLLHDATMLDMKI